MKYVSDTLGVKIKIEPWDGTDKLPYYLTDRYEIKKAVIGSVLCLLMKPMGELDTLPAIKKHISKVHEAEALPIVLDLDVMTARRRESLIKSHIPFVAPSCHIYLPFLGIALNERYASIKTIGDTLMPSSQLLLFHYLYQTEPELRTGETAEIFDISAMQVSRAVKQLTALRLIQVKKEGSRIIIYSNEQRRDLFERARPYLLNPVRKRFYAEFGGLPKDLPISGYSALSELTMLGSPSLRTFAFFGNVSEFNVTGTLVDNTVQAEVEVWYYNPELLSKYRGIVDVLSLVISLTHDDDPRVEESINEVLLKVWE